MTTHHGEDAPRAYTTEEVREKFLEHVWHMINYWETQVDASMDTHNRLTGVAFSLLSALDGCAMDLPAFSVAPLPHAEDQQYRKDEGENWYPMPASEDVVCDIGGGLHELFYTVGRALHYEPEAPSSGGAHATSTREPRAQPPVVYEQGEPVTARRGLCAACGYLNHGYGEPDNCYNCAAPLSSEEGQS